MRGCNGFPHSYPASPTQAAPCREVPRRATGPYYEHTIEFFSPGRCMLKSNFAVDMLSCRYNVVWNSFKRVTGEHPMQEKAKLFRGTATRV